MCVCGLRENHKKKSCVLCMNLAESPAASVRVKILLSYDFLLLNHIRDTGISISQEGVAALCTVKRVWLSLHAHGIQQPCRMNSPHVLPAYRGQIRGMVVNGKC